MTKKIYSYDRKTVSLLKHGEFWLDGMIDTACNSKEICNELNSLVDELNEIKSACEEYNINPKKLRKVLDDFADCLISEWDCNLNEEEEYK